MKILYSAFTANPYAGSEAQCGWSWAYAMKDYNQVFLLTREENRPYIDKFVKENNIKNLRVFYHDIPSFLNIYGKTGKLYFLYYLMWEKSVYKTIKKLHKEYNFDIVQHITLGDFRVIGSAAKVKTDFIFGPVGGAQLTPKVFEPYVLSHKKSEKVREIINSLVKLNLSYRIKLNKAKLVLAANKETQEYLSSMMKHPQRCKLLTENGIMAEKIEPIVEKNIDDKKEINVLWSGRMIYRKGLTFLLEAFSQVKSDRNIKLRLLGTGEEIESLKIKAKALGIADRVNFIGKVPYTQVKSIYDKSHIFVFPSLRETTGTVLFEAMSCAIPIITFNQNGADLLVDESCGIKVNINQPLENIKADFANAIKELAENDKLRNELGKNAYCKILEEYTWEAKCQSFEEKFLNEE